MPLKIFSISKNDWAGCGYFLSQAVNEHTEHHSRAFRKERSLFDFPHELTHLTGQRLKALWNWADVIHIHDNPGFDVTKMPHKPIVVTYHGTRYRNAPEVYNRLARKRGWLATVATPDLTQFGLPWLPDTRPDLSHLYDPSDEFTVCHAPSKRDVKGTERVIEACKRAEVKLDLIEDVSWEECIQRKAKCHLLIDQFELGYGCNAIEAWSLRIPVIADGIPEVLDAIIKQFDYLPFESAFDERTIGLMFSNRDYWQDWADTGWEHYYEHHRPKVAAETAVTFYHRAIDEWVPGNIRVVRSVQHEWPKAAKLVLLRYLGNNVGTTRWFPENGSGIQYTFSGKEPVRYVLETDVEWFMNQKTKKETPLFEVLKK